jgi:ABC-type branched-subunit amino acid transport system ATPase component
MTEPSRAQGLPRCDPSRAERSPAVLVTESVSVSYGGVRALSQVSIEVAAGELVGLIGPNGAGKTTFIDAVCGFTPSAGRVHVCGRDVSGWRPHRRARAGLARTFQAVELFEDLTVRENVAATAYGRDHRSGLAGTIREIVTGRLTELPEVDRALAAIGLTDLADRPVDALPQGQRKLVGVARALASRGSVICLDEPAAGLDTAESRELGRRLRGLADNGTALLLVDHDMDLVLSICDRIIVLAFGEVIASGTPEEVRCDPAVIAAYLGDARDPRSDHQPDPQPTVGARGAGGAPLLEVCGLTAGYDGVPVLRDLDLSVAEGEIVALLGANGAGKTTTLRVLSRLLDPQAGRVVFDGADIAGEPVHLLARRGLVHVPDDRGVFFGLTVAEHFRGAAHTTLDLQAVLGYLPALGDLLDRRAGLLSGGEQQMLALGLALARKPRLLLIDEMSVGLAPVIVARLLPIVRRYCQDSGAAAILVEQHVDLALGIADRAYVLAHGSVRASGSAAELRHDRGRLTASYLGGDAADD